MIPPAALSLTLLFAVQDGRGGLQRVGFDNPGLVVDLGVGLWAWPMPMDYDKDGDMDLVVSCPDVPSNGTYFFENPTPRHTPAKKPVFLPPVRIEAAMRNVQVSFVDGAPRVLAPGREFRAFRERGYGDALRLPAATPVHGARGRTRANQWKFADYDGDGTLDLIVGAGEWSDYGWDNAFDTNGNWTRGPLRGLVYLLHNEGTNAAPRYAKPRRLEAGGALIDVYGMPSPNLGDFDGDGDLDLICGEFLDGFTWFQNVGTRTVPRYAKGRRLENGGRRIAMDLCMITPVAVDWDRDGDLDLVVGDEDGRVALVENTGRVERGMPLFEQPYYFQQRAADLKFGALVTPVSCDWDGDGDEDLICGNTAGHLGFIENLGLSGTSPRFAAPRLLEVDGRIFRIQAGPNGSIQGPCEAKWGYTTPFPADWNHDGLLDIIVNSIWGKVLWLENTGTRREPRLAAPQAIEVAWQGGAPRPAWNWWQPKGNELATQWRTTPCVIDWNGDGLVDLVMLDHEGYLAFFERTRNRNAPTLLPGRRVFFDERRRPLRLNTGVAGRSGRRKLCFVDWDGDGRRDLLVNSRNVDFWRNVTRGKGPWTFRNMGALGRRRLAGHTTSPTVVDWDGDGVRDLLVGAEDGRFYHLRNPRMAEQPPGILKSEFVFDAAPFPRCHASTIAEVDGRLVAAWFGGSHEKHEDVGIWVARHDGNSWTPPVEVADGVQHTTKRYPTWNPVLFQPRLGRLLLFYKCGPDPRRWWGMLTTSDDHGATWSLARRLPEDILGPVKNKPIELEDGTLLCPSSGEQTGWRLYFERTRDLGRTWRRIGPVNDGKTFAAIQPTILRHPNGRLQALCRTRQKRIAQTWSEDGGETWSEVTATDLPNPNAAIDAVTLRDGRQLLVYNHSERGRSPLNVALSSDGKSWQTVLVLESSPGEYSYPAVIQTRDGLVHITYTWKRRCIRHVVLDPERFQLREGKRGR